MRLAILRVLGLALWRDRGALVMSFALPVVVFLIFAAIFGGATGEQLRLRVALADEAGTSLSQRMVDAVRRSHNLRIVATVANTAAVQGEVASGAADVGLVVRRGGRGLDEIVGDGPAPLLVITHPARAVAGALLTGSVQRLYFSELPDAALRGVVRLVDDAIVELTDEQRAEASAQLDALAPEGGASDSEAFAPFDALVEQQHASSSGAAVDQVAYYAGAVAALFVLLSAVISASSLHDDLESGVVDRVLAGPGGIAPLVDGRAAFLVAQGVAQAALIFGVAWAAYGVSLSGRLGPWLLVTVALATASAGLMLLLATLCQTARQSHTVSNVIVLVISAVGGSMVPRFLMPPWLQQAGWATPNAWALEGYAAALRAGAPWATPILAAGVLMTVGVTGWMGARVLARRWETM
jgi:ABC-2 type transport system permease protein